MYMDFASYKANPVHFLDFDTDIAIGENETSRPTYMNVHKSSRLQDWEEQLQYNKLNSQLQEKLIRYLEILFLGAQTWILVQRDHTKSIYSLTSL